MLSDQFWEVWARFLQRSKLDGAAALLLEASGPIKILLAQTVYFSQPFLSLAMPKEEWSAVAHLLENSAESESFARFLREEGRD